MQRVIKFRAWDTKNRELFILTLDDLMAGEYRLHRPEYEISQFTGLTDKNGKEIWEGDILKAQDKTIWNVNFEYGSFGAQCVSTRFKGASDWHSFATISFENLAVKVIGNIYENPELLQS